MKGQRYAVRQKSTLAYRAAIIMQNIKLDARLSQVASMVRNGSRVADIGTDHAYLPAYLVLNGISPCAVASDIREMPLKNAQETVNAFGLADKIKTVLSDGLGALEENCADDIILAGMGGLLIAEILSDCDWIKNKSINIIAQPMTHAEAVREYFIQNGYEITKEKAALDGKHKYCVMRAFYSGEKKQYPFGYIYYGELMKENTPQADKFLSMQLSRLKKRYNALSAKGLNRAECDYLKSVIDDFENALKTRNNLR